MEVHYLSIKTVVNITKREDPVVTYHHGFKSRHPHHHAPVVKWIGTALRRQITGVRVSSGALFMGVSPSGYDIGLRNRVSEVRVLSRPLN